MSIRENLGKNRIVGVGIGVALLVLAASAIAVEFWPEKKPDLLMQYYTDDEGQTWFSDEVSNVAPFDHGGKTAVIAQLFTYDNGSKKYCAYLVKYTPDAKKRLDAAVADAKAKGQPASEIPLLHDPLFMRSNALVKLPGSGHDWVPFLDPSAIQVFAPHSPDGSAVDQVFVY
jgi:hypothetical protein